MSIKKQVPYDEGLDNTLNLLHERYLFIKNRVNQYQYDIFETHLLGQKVICMTGEEAAKIFYDSELFIEMVQHLKEYKKHYLELELFNLWMETLTFIENVYSSR
ncbi:hypothetical protein [Clostridioides sp. ZZV14-6345]|uniref:hypothetical protein n=1 Tax=unclassified Clostridioides TaxID=2635829 RepID=UPI0027D34684